MLLEQEYRSAQAAERAARLRRGMVLRAMRATGSSQRAIAASLGVTQPAISQQLDTAPNPADVPPDVLLDAAAPLLRRIAAERGFTDLAVFGSVARGQSRRDSDIDLLVQPPEHTTITELIELRELFAQILCRSVDLVTYNSLTPGVDDDITREAVPL